MKKKNVILLIIFIVIIGGLIGILGAKSNLEANLEQLKEMAISKVDFSKLKDGTYTGSYKVFPIAVEVKTTINNHRITEIELVKHSNGQGSKAEIIPSKVIEAQSLGIDIVSGATYSSKVILKAIENALTDAY